MEMNTPLNTYNDKYYFKMPMNLEIDSKKLAYNSNFSEIMIQDMNKVPSCAVLLYIKGDKSLAVASIARDVGSSSTNRSSDIMH